jgi:hypothetical protein
MTDPLAVTGDRITFPDVLMAGNTGLTDPLNEQVAVPPLLVPNGEHRRVVPSAPRQGRHLHLRSSRLVLLGTLVAPLVIAGYVGLAVLLFLPLLGLRRILRRRATPPVVRWDGDAPPCSGVGNLWDAATRSA